MLSTDSCQFSTSAVKSESAVFSCENQAVEDGVEAVQQQQQPAPLSGKRRRACLKRDRRKRKRQALAKRRQCGPADKSENEQDEDDDKAEEEQRAQERLHQEWLEREITAQEEFKLRKEKEEAAQKKKEDEERRIREEWEEQQRKERELQEQKLQEKRDREEAVQKLLDQAESQLENGGYWKNPDAPLDFGTEKDKANCPFFIKTGACRFGDRCSRKHDHPASSSTLMVRGMFVTFAMAQSRRDDYDTDASLEYSEDEVRQQFMDFYEDVLPEFKNAGKVVQFKASCNFEPHLRGNVYVQYDTEDQCKEAFKMFNGRWYAGKQLQCEFSPVTKWKTAICGLFDRQKCPKGKHCNFLHVFQNPSNEFWEADRDLHLSSDRCGGFSGRHRMSSQRGYSPEQSCSRWSELRSRSREKQSHRRTWSRSREGRSRSRSRESRRAHRSLRREHGSLNDRGRRSRSRERPRSRSRGRETDGQSGGRHSHGDSRTGSSRRSESNIPEEQSKNGSVKRKSRKSESKSPKNGDASSSHHHKRSKKGKKKKKCKKKQKRKRSKSCSHSSSAASGEVSEDDKDEVTPGDDDKQNTEMPGEDVEISEPLTSLADNTETLSSTS